MTRQSSFAAGRDERGRGARSALARPPARIPYLRAAVAPSAAITGVCVVAAAAVVLGGAPLPAVRAVLSGVAFSAVLMLVIVISAARSAARQVAERVRGARLAAQRGQAELQQMADQVLRGEQPPLPVPPDPRPADGDPFSQLMDELVQSQHHARQVVLRIADKKPESHSDERVEISVNLARRMQSLVHREIELLDELESKVEDPDLLKGLFTVDHLATRMRRQSESLAVLGGSTSRRQWTRQVTMHEVLRAAVAEVEQYSRVKIMPPVEGVLRSNAVTDVIHLIAELVENATKFSAPHTTTQVRAQHVPAGVAIEIEDRGLGILADDQRRMNDLLDDPGRMDINELLRDGRIGLYVVAMLARRHGIRVRLQGSVYGGTQAVVELPVPLLEEPDHGRGHPGADRQQEAGARRALVPAGGGLAVAGLAGAPVSYGSDFSQPAAQAPGARPPLPKRQGQLSAPPDQPDGHRDEPGPGPVPSAAGSADHRTGLMADFLNGARRAENEDSPARD